MKFNLTNWSNWISVAYTVKNDRDFNSKKL